MSAAICRTIRCLAPAAIGLRKDDEALRQEINGAIAKILADGTYKKLAGKYFSFDVYSGT